MVMKYTEMPLIQSIKDDGELEKSEGFWQELFLLKPDGLALRRILDTFTAEDLLHLQV